MRFRPFSEIIVLATASFGSPYTYDITVAKDGSGSHRAICRAFKQYATYRHLQRKSDA